MESSDKTWSTGEGNGKPLQFLALRAPGTVWKAKRYDTGRWTLQVGSCPVWYWRNNSRKNDKVEPKWKQHPVVDVTGDGSKVQCCKEQYCIGTWNVRSMSQGKLEAVRQQMARVNNDILGISKLKRSGMGEFNSDDHCIYTVGKNPLEEME